MIRDFLSADDFSDDVAEAGIFFPVKPQPPKPEECNCDLSCVDDLPVGATYAPMQKFRKLYSPEEALCRGTLFEELDLPFRGGKQR
ncbi:MAG: spore coat associated protein CotJA [Clostridia bacterium]|nr:spore coat associated protein CotJA [Clostridia bacterium]